VSGVVTVSVGASDNVGVTRVDLYVNGSLLASDTNAPYNFSWNTTSLAGTNVTLSAVAFDAAGNSASSAPVTVAVSAPTPATPDTTPPTVAISNPLGGTTVSGMVNIKASASDNVAVAGMTLCIDGVVVSTGNSASVSYKWNTRKAPAGTHTITATAKDTSGNQATTSVVVSK
jgi:hypothetical protein